MDALAGSLRRQLQDPFWESYLDTRRFVWVGGHHALSVRPGDTLASQPLEHPDRRSKRLFLERDRGRGLWLLLVPTTLVLCVPIASAFRPLQLGPFVIIAVSFTDSRGYCGLWIDPNPYPVPGPGLVGGKFQVDAPGVNAGVDFGGWHYSVTCFRGQRAR